MANRKIGIIGYGLIGSYVYDALRSEKSIDVVFIHDADPARLATLPKEVALADLAGFAERDADLICELAHAEVSRRWGEKILSACDYFLLSVTALGDRELEVTLRRTADETGHRLFIPHGGVMGLDAIIDGREMWEEVSIEMTKHPRNLDFTASGIAPAGITRRTVLYDGPTRGVCAKFPRNVNTHATLALAGIGMDRNHSVLIADPQSDAAVITISARGGGVEMKLHRAETITGVSGASTPWSVLQSILRTTTPGPGTHFC